MATVKMLAVNKILDDQVILNNINLGIEKGEFVAVVGPSGSGKSTLLRLVAGLDSVSDGKILINNQCVNTIPPSRRNMAMVFQNYALYPHMTVYANMAYGLKMRGMKKHVIQQKVSEVSKLLKLDEYLERKPMALSGGQRQRVAMGRAMVRSPAVFLFDEPLSNLDTKLRSEMRHEIKRLHQQFNTTSLYVTHDQTEAMTLADRVVILNKGTIEQVDTPQNVYQNPATMFVASFIGHYPINFIPARYNPDTKHIESSIGYKLPLPNDFKLHGRRDKNLIIGIRPEHLTVVEDTTHSDFLGKIEWVDDMGSDKLVQVNTEIGNLRLSVRMLKNIDLSQKVLAMRFDPDKATIFCEETGLKLGG